MRKHFDSPRKFGFERLEDRALLSATVTFNFNGGIYDPTSPVALELGSATGNVTLVVQQAGANAIKVTGGATKIIVDNGSGPKSYNSFTFQNVTQGIDLDLTGSGRDVVTMVNVHGTGADDDSPQDSGITISLGNSTSVVSMVNVSTDSGLDLEGGNGRTVVALSNVSAGAGENFTVDLGDAKLNTVTVVHCSGGDATFNDDGSSGILVGVSNHFDSHIVDTFHTRIGDLKNDTFSG